MITMQRHILGALVRHHQLPQTALGAPFFDIPPDPGYAAQVAEWHDSLPAESRISPEALAVIAAPALVSDVRVFQGRNSLTRTWAMAAYSDKSGPFLLAASLGDGSGLKLEVVDSRDTFSDTLLTWLIAGGEPSEPEMKVQMSHSELAVLLAIMDLYSRAAFSAYITHAPVEDAYSASLITQSYKEAVAVDDPRWLLSFAGPVLDEDATRLDPNGVWAALQGLAQRGLVEIAGQDWKLTLPGQYVAESFHRRKVTIAIETVAANPDSTLGTHAAMLIRSDEPLWFIDLPPGGAATLTGVSVQGARDILDALFTPGAPAPPPRPAAPPLGTAPPAYGAPAAPPQPTPGTGAAMRFCPSCGNPLTAGMAFCMNCGARVG